MKKQFSFKDSSRTSADQKDHSQNITVLTEYCSNRSKNSSWTDIRVEEIKRKYDTPSHRRRNTNLDRLKTDFSDICLLQKSSNQKVEATQLFEQKINTNYNEPKRWINNSIKETKNENKENKENKIEQDEILVFQKIKQMKESIMQQKNKKMNGVMSSKTLFYDHQRTYFPLRQYTNKESLDPRIQNIDKINNKIKKILQCLHQNENFSKKKNDENSFRENLSSQELQNSNNKKYNFQQTQILARQQIKYLAENTQEKQSEECLIQSSRKKWVRNQESIFVEKIQTNQQKWKKEFEQQNNLKNQQSMSHDSSRTSEMNFGNNLKDIRSKSCLGVEAIFSKKNRQSTSSKKYDDEISKIQQRIKHFQDAKRKLEIEFKPFKYQGNSKSLIFQQSQNKFSEKPPLLRDSQPSTQRKATKTNEDISLKMNKNIDSKVQTERSQLSSRQYLQKMRKKEKQNEQLKRKTDQGMADRKRRLNQMDNVIINLQSIDKLAEIFCQQVDLDQHFRNAKMWLASSCLNDNKWVQIQYELESIGIKMSEEQVVKQFQVVQEQQNPFYSLRENAQSIKSVVEKYRKSKQFWSDNALHKFTQSSLKQQKCLQSRIDLQKKGFFIIEDFVRFLNMQSGKFYRNRDLLLLWKRFTLSQQLQCETFFSVLSNQQY